MDDDKSSMNELLIWTMNFNDIMIGFIKSYSKAEYICQISTKCLKLSKEKIIIIKEREIEKANSNMSNCSQILNSTSFFFLLYQSRQISESSKKA